ncbi:MAG: hypothetical protein KKF77_08225 [Proteobacteria bacterium]|nr:hypothetical protein [Pseudomonadota bacterium]
MSKSAASVLADFLEQRAKAVRAIEAEAEAIIHGDGHVQGDQAGYVAKMRQKAMLLADLAGDAQGLVLALAHPQSDAAADRLERFSQSAATSLKVGSPFFMSALLYPDEHKPGEPNDLESYVTEVRSWG